MSTINSKNLSFLRGTFEPYIQPSQSALNNSNSSVQFISRPKPTNLSFQLSSTKKCNSNLGFSQTIITQQKKLRSSKSCAKGCKLGVNESGKSNIPLSTQYNWLESIYAPDKVNIYKAILSSSKKLPNNQSTDNKKNPSRYDEKKAEKSIYSSLIYLSQNKSASNRRLINNSALQKNATRSVKRKKSKVNNLEKTLEIDPSTGLTNATTAKYKDNSNEYIENALSSTLINNLKMIISNNNTDNFDNMLHKKFEIINEAFNGAIIQGHSFRNVLKQIQSLYQELFADYNSQFKVFKEGLKSLKDDFNKYKEQSKNDKDSLNKLIDTKTVEIENKNIVIKKLKSEAENIKKQANEQIKEITEDLNELYNENKRLTKVAKKLYNELCKSKDQQDQLEQFIEEKSQYKIEMPHKVFEKKILEIGKNKVKLPTLDLTRLESKKPARLKVVEYYKGDNDSEEQSVIEISASEGGIFIIYYVVYNLNDVNDESVSNSEIVEGNVHYNLFRRIHSDCWE